MLSNELSKVCKQGDSRAHALFEHVSTNAHLTLNYPGQFHNKAPERQELCKETDTRGFFKSVLSKNHIPTMSIGRSSLYSDSANAFVIQNCFKFSARKRR